MSGFRRGRRRRRRIRDDLGVCGSHGCFLPSFLCQNYEEILKLDFSSG